MIIDCNECVHFESEGCKDCLVTAILEPQSRPVEIGPEEQEAIEALQEVGLAPILLFQLKAG